MSSKKYRKRLRKCVILQQYSSDAARIFFKRESDELYHNELSEINSDMSATEIWIRSQMAYSHYYGSGYMNWLEWHFGGIKLYFSIPERKGKIRAKDLIVRRAND